MDVSARVAKLTTILDVAKAMSAERDLDALLALIADAAARVVDADRCTLFVLDPDQGLLWSRVAQGLATQEIRLPVGRGIAGQVAEANEVLSIADAYADERFNRAVDHTTGYRTRTILAAPMRGAQGEVVGVIQALNHRGDRPFGDEDTELLLALGGQAAVAIQNALLNEAIERLFEGFVKASVVAIESRDPTTSGHSERVARLTVSLAEVVDRADGPRFADTRFTPEALREIRYASLLHDFGKVGVREHVLIKANKLQPWEHERLKLRFALARAGLERDHWRQVATGAGDPDALAAALATRLEDLEGFWRFVEQCNRPTVLEAGGFERLQDLAGLTLPGDGGPAPLLTAHEVERLSIPRGSLSPEERTEIESHVTHTFRFLQQIPWTRDLRRIPEIAYAHHEKLDGRGYPRGLPPDQIPLGSRLMTVSDIYDALTASDRPYKRAVPHHKALDILQGEAGRGLIDADVLRLFIDAEVPRRALPEPPA